MITVNISKRPTSIRNESKNVLKSPKLAKLEIGPKALRPGPELDMQAIEAETPSVKEYPSSEIEKVAKIDNVR